MASASFHLLHNNSAFPKHPSSSFHPLLPLSSLRCPSRIRASSAVATESVQGIQQASATEFDYFACPLCYEPLIRMGPPGFNVPAIYRSGFKCQNCNKAYSSKEIYLDLTVTSGTKEYTESKPNRTELFRSPLVSFVYERGWRQAFNRSGFPGPDEEFEMAQEFFKPVEGGLLVDVSCGSGLFSRKFAKSGTYSAVIALDFSENMLRQCYDFIKKDETVLAANLALVRADVSRLPFSSGSVDGVHAGAALHCWPSPSNAVAEISRILRSGGVFVGSTFLASGPNPLRQGALKPAWLEALYTQKFFVGCSAHETAKKNEKNICCLDCCTSICPHCLPSHRYHRLLQVRRYVYHDVVRLEDLEKLIDCSYVQAYTINSAKVVFIKKRPQNRQFKGCGNYCSSCDRSLQEPYIHCSLGCKVDFVLKHNKDLSPYLRPCKSLQLSPDFLMPIDTMDTGDDESPHSTIVDSDDPLSSSSSSGSSSENMSMNMTMPYTQFVRKKRTGLYVFARSASRVSDEDMATNMSSRRKGVPQRSPMC